MSAPVPVDDDARVAALRQLGVLDAPPAADLDALTRLASYVTGAPFSFVNLVDAHRQWTAAAFGMDSPGSMPRDDTLCAYTVAQDSPLLVPDLSVDPRFSDHPWVDGTRAELRAYSGVPVHDRTGYAVGALCVVDITPRDLDSGQLSALKDLAAQAEHLLEMRRQHLELIDRIEQIGHLATHDALTGLPNRRVLTDRLEHASARSRRSGVFPVVFFCDVDDFKAVNDTFGHDVGDDTLRAVAAHIRRSVRPADTVARLGGDEFVVICEDLPDEFIAAVAERLRAVVTPVVAADGSRTVRLSVGAFRAEVASTVEEVLVAADRLMYVDKHQHRRAT